jgi:hypothetical protein
MKFSKPGEQNLTQRNQNSNKIHNYFCTVHTKKTINNGTAIDGKNANKNVVDVLNNWRIAPYCTKAATIVSELNSWLENILAIRLTAPQHCFIGAPNRKQLKKTPKTKNPLDSRPRKQWELRAAKASWRRFAKIEQSHLSAGTRLFLSRVGFLLPANKTQRKS